MSRPSLAAALICKNEVNNFPILFESIKGCFDEVHVTDTGSTDGTIEYLSDLVKSGKDKEVLGCPLYLHFFEWCQDFAAARNASFKPVKTDYVMWLDLDDVLEGAESFKLWRDTAMGLADYWLATYHYAYDDAGNPVCSFMRERVVKNPYKDIWKYFVHEGMKPLDGWKAQYAITWNVKHRRTLADIQKDKGRNLAIFEKNKKDLDTRMIWYYGKELFESQRPLDAFAPLVEAISRPDLENHDRILGITYACYSALQCKQPEKAIQLAHQGLMLDQNRAEFHSVLGDAYAQAGNLRAAIPFYYAAKNCFNSAPQGGKFFGAIYNHQSAYGPYPTEQLAKIFLQMADFDRSEQECMDGIKKYKSVVCEQILAEIVKARALTVPDKASIVDSDDIVFSTPPQGAYPWDSEIYRTKAVGGSEAACVEMATWLKKKTKHRVIVFNPRESIFIDKDGVEYHPVKDLLAYFSKYKPRLHIAWRHNNKLTDAPTYSWVHDLMLPGAEQGLHSDAALCLTEFHRDYLMSMQGIPREKLVMTRNGIDVSRFDGPIVKDPNKVIWPSSPDRGLERAIAIVEEARKTLPDLRLEIFYGWENLEKYGLGDLAKKLKAMVAERPWCIYRGGVDQKSMAKEWMSAAAWVYPANFIESFGLVAPECQLSGTYGIVRNIGALKNTFKKAHDEGRGILLDSEGLSEKEVKEWAAHLVDAIQNKKWEKCVLTEKEKRYFEWSRVADEWIEMFGLDMTGQQNLEKWEKKQKEPISRGLTNVTDVQTKERLATNIMEALG